MPKNNFNTSNGSPNWQGRSGLDPIDTSRIAAHTEGIFLRRLFTLNVRTRNVFSLITMLIFGVGATGFMLFAIYGIIDMVDGKKLDLEGYLILSPLVLVFGLVLFIGLTLLINFMINVGIILGIGRNKFRSKNGKEQNRKEAKKKFPKRRKDFK